jgi:membrane associated rhomboid family serine protease
MVKYIFVLVFILVHIFFDARLGYSNSSPLWTHFTYMFQHAGAVHLLINSLAFISIFRILERIIPKYRLALTIVILGVSVSFCVSYDLPVVGASSMICFMIGMYASHLGCLVKSGKLPMSKCIPFLLSISIYMIVSLIKHNSAFSLHLLSLSSGIIFMSIYNLRSRLGCLRLPFCRKSHPHPIC